MKSTIAIIATATALSAHAFDLGAAATMQGKAAAAGLAGMAIDKATTAKKPEPQTAEEKAKAEEEKKRQMQALKDTATNTAAGMAKQSLMNKLGGK